MAKNSTVIKPIHVNDVQPENMQKGDGWAISEFRLPVTGAHGSATTIFHSIFRPGSTHAKHLHARCDEIAVYLKGHGIVGWMLLVFPQSYGGAYDTPLLNDAITQAWVGLTFKYNIAGAKFSGGGEAATIANAHCFPTQILPQLCVEYNYIP